MTKHMLHDAEGRPLANISCADIDLEANIALWGAAGSIPGNHDLRGVRVVDGAAVPIPERPTDAAAFDFVAGAWVDPRTLADLQAEAWARIKAERERVEFGGFDWDGSRFDSDLISQSRIQGTVLLAQLALQAGQPFSIAWTLADNTRRTLSAADVAAVGVAMGVHIRAAHERAAGLRALIVAATTPEDLEAITWD